MIPPENHSNLNQPKNKKTVNYLGKTTKDMTVDLTITGSIINDLKHQLEKSSDKDRIKSKAAKILKVFHKNSAATIEKYFEKNPGSSKIVTKAYSNLTDKTLEAVFFVCEEILYPRPSKKVKEFSVISVGGYLSVITSQELMLVIKKCKNNCIKMISNTSDH